MSYDIWLKIEKPSCDACGRPAEDRTEGDWGSCTSNLASMWCAAGADLAKFHGKLAGDCIQTLGEAIGELKAQPARYIAMNPENGWGSYADLVPALEKLLAIFQEWPHGVVVVSK